jgi:hypothetical protein
MCNQICSTVKYFEQNDEIMILPYFPYKTQRGPPWEFDSDKNQGSEKMSIFCDSRYDSEILGQLCKMSILILVNYSFWVFIGQKTNPFGKEIVKTAKNSKNDPTKTFYYVKISFLSDFQHKNLF